MYRENVIENYSSVEKETLKAYGAEMWTELFPTAQELGVSKHGQVWQYSLTSSMNEKITQVDDFVKESLIKMIIGLEKDFDLSWEKMKQDIIDMGILEVNKEVTELIQMKMKLWEN